MMCETPGCLTEARLGEIRGNEVMVHGPGLGRKVVFIDDEGGKECFSGHSVFLSR